MVIIANILKYKLERVIFEGGKSRDLFFVIFEKKLMPVSPAAGETEFDQRRELETGIE